MEDLIKTITETKDLIRTITESKSCPYCYTKDKEINSIDGKLLPNCSGDDVFSIIYKDYDDPQGKCHLLISSGRKGGLYRPKYCPECGRKL
jgi:hypothetical protein